MNDSSECDCELRDRQWNGYGRCLRCQRRYVDPREHRRHGIERAGAGDVGFIELGQVLGPCPRCGAILHVTFADDPKSGRRGRAITHPVPFCSYYGETDPAAIEAAIKRGAKP